MRECIVQYCLFQRVALNLKISRYIVVVWLSFMVSAVGFTSCGDEEFGDVDPDVLPAVVSFENHIAPRMNYYCVGCHNKNGQLGNAGGWNLEGYWQTRLAIESIEKVSFEEKTMPPGGARRMTSWDAALFRKWRDEDYPE